jgi:hypothetical protein
MARAQLLATAPEDPEGWAPAELAFAPTGVAADLPSTPELLTLTRSAMGTSAGPGVSAAVTQQRRKMSKAKQRTLILPDLHSVMGGNLRPAPAQ